PISTDVLYRASPSASNIGRCLRPGSEQDDQHEGQQRAAGLHRASLPSPEAFDNLFSRSGFSTARGNSLSPERGICLAWSPLTVAAVCDRRLRFGHFRNAVRLSFVGSFVGSFVEVPLLASSHAAPSPLKVYEKALVLGKAPTPL